MYITYVSFNFQSGDLEAEERNYLGHHVALARRFPGLRQYYTGRLMKTGGKEPDRIRGAIMTYDSSTAAEAAMRSDVVPPLITDTQAHLKDLTSHSAEGEVIVPFDSRRAEQRCFTMIAEFDLEQSAGASAAEERYLSKHTGIARRLPGLRNYIIGKLMQAPGGDVTRNRMAILVFDSLEAYRAAYASQLGLELQQDEAATIRNAQVRRLDARVEI
ncbi:MAG: EthD family reductase [Candidatus Binatus sp.]|uniref:EthD family reductase n=1 Tax=Candidatus Binatus sp. TaxID=2811406 RepID=UPI002724342A|nr:EthD family reductase [Candidatus Binatus sp.]MDO8433587.1 EthD family reductase [Candidatus Binatus sp.]